MILTIIINQINSNKKLAIKLKFIFNKLMIDKIKAMKNKIKLQIMKI